MKTAVFLLLTLFLSGCAASGSLDQSLNDMVYPVQHSPHAITTGLINNRDFLKKCFAHLELNIDSLQDEVETMNRFTKGKEWEYQISLWDHPSRYGHTAGTILRFYKSNQNTDGSSGKTLYGEELGRLPYR